MQLSNHPEFSAACGRTDSHAFLALILPHANENGHPQMRLIIIAVDENGELAERPPIVNATIHGGPLDEIYYDSLVEFASSWVNHGFGGMTSKPIGPKGRVVDFEPTESFSQLADRVTALGWNRATFGLLEALGNLLPPTEQAKVCAVIRRNEELATKPVRPCE